MYYTLGQRSGIGIGGQRDTAAEPWYVAGKDMERNRLSVVQGHDHPRLLSPALEAVQLHWISDKVPALPLRCMAKTRYRQADQACRVSQPGQAGCRVEFDVPQRAVTPGQYVVFYDGEECLGGGIIATPVTEHAGLQAETG
jgi:tRNA-specific 2-thiouridylase